MLCFKLIILYNISTCNGSAKSRRYTGRSERQKQREQDHIKRNDMKRDDMEYVYILKCGDGSLYTGWTNDIKKRFTAHCAGKGAKYTRGRGPLTLVHLEVFNDRTEAQRREASIKKLTRAAKLLLVSGGSEKDAEEIIRQVNGDAIQDQR